MTWQHGGRLTKWILNWVPTKDEHRTTMQPLQSGRGKKLNTANTLLLQFVHLTIQFKQSFLQGMYSTVTRPCDKSSILILSNKHAMRHH